MKKLPLSKKAVKYKDKYALVDDDIFSIVNQYNWSYQKASNNVDEYAHNNKLLHKSLHRFIWELKNGNIPEEYFIDHIDGNGLNNQIKNLRLATASENTCNSKRPKHNTSGLKGIDKCVDKRRQKHKDKGIRWRARIMKNGKRIQKSFPYTDKGLKDAIEWYKQKSLELHKEFSIYNRPDENK